MLIINTYVNIYLSNDEVRPLNYLFLIVKKWKEKNYVDSLCVVEIVDN